MNDDYPILVGVDVETSGFSPTKDSITELGSAMASTNGKLLDEFVEFAKPKHAIPKHIIKLTGITNEMVANAELPHIVVENWINWIGKRKVALVGHNLFKFDIPMLIEPIREFHNVLIPNFFCIDTLHWIKKFVPYNGKGTHKLEVLAEKIGYTPDVSHRALDDAKATIALVAYIIRTFEKPKTIEELRSVLLANSTPITKIIKL